VLRPGQDGKQRDVQKSDQDWVDVLGGGSTGGDVLVPRPAVRQPRSSFSGAQGWRRRGIRRVNSQVSPHHGSLWRGLPTPVPELNHGRPPCSQWCRGLILKLAQYPSRHTMSEHLPHSATRLHGEKSRRPPLPLTRSSVLRAPAGSRGCRRLIRVTPGASYRLSPVRALTQHCLAASTDPGLTDHDTKL